MNILYGHFGTSESQIQIFCIGSLLRTDVQTGGRTGMRAGWRTDIKENR